MTSPIVPSDECVEPIWVDKADTEAPPPVHGFAAVLWRTSENHRPPGLSRIRWHTPLRGPSLTSVFGIVLLLVLPILIITGLLSYLPTDRGPLKPGPRSVAVTRLCRLR